MADHLPDLDPDVQNSLSELMQDDYELLLRTFMRDAQMRLEYLRLNLGAQDWAAFRYAAHSFRGSCGNMGALALQEACNSAEQAALQANAAAASQAFEDIVSLYERVQLQLTQLLPQ
jgi:HPt (histidine-containing phosphotransfer) domain-containing protein